MMPKTLPAAFYETLQEEISLSEELLRLLAQEKTALIGMEMEPLVALSGKKAILVGRLQTMDARLQELARSFTGAPAEETVRLRALAAQLEGEEAKKVESHRARIAALREEIVARTVINKGFSAEINRFLNDAISTITSAVAERPMYSRGRGFAKPSLSQPSLISREV